MLLFRHIIIKSSAELSMGISLSCLERNRLVCIEDIHIYIYINLNPNIYRIVRYPRFLEPCLVVFPICTQFYTSHLVITAKAGNLFLLPVLSLYIRPPKLAAWLWRLYLEGHFPLGTGGLFSNSKLVYGGIVHLQLYRLVFFEHETRKQKLPNLHQAAFIFFKCWWCASLQQYDITGILRYLGSLATKSTIEESSGAKLRMDLSV